MKIFTNHRYALITGIVLTLVLAWLLRMQFAPPDAEFALNVKALGRWLHIGAGIFWIGILYYFNAVQVPALADAAADKGGPGGAGISKYVAPRALFWFRWAAFATWLMGVWLLSDMRPNGVVEAFTLGLMLPQIDYQMMVIGIGAWLGFDNDERQHQSLGYYTPRKIYQEGLWVWGRSASLTGSASPASRASSKGGEMLASPTYPQAPQPAKDFVLMK